MPSDNHPLAAAHPVSPQQHTKELQRQIETALKNYLKLPRACPALLREGMEYAVLAPGKRFRPLLTLLAAEVCEGRVSAAMPAACAVEMVHAYSLVHDDLPSMDDDDFRRGQPTCHKQYGEAIAILVGDGLLARAFEVLAGEVQPGHVAGECCRILAKAAGPCRLVGGQADDVAPDAATWTLPRLESMHERKTGALILAALQLGAVVAGAHDEELAALKTYGRRLGLAFQIADDLLDVVGDEEVPGSVPNRDEQLGKLTFPGLLGIPASAGRLQLLVDQATTALIPFGPKAATLQALATGVWERAKPACAKRLETM